MTGKMCLVNRGRDLDQVALQILQIGKIQIEEIQRKAKKGGNILPGSDLVPVPSIEPG